MPRTMPMILEGLKSSISESHSWHSGKMMEIMSNGFTSTSRVAAFSSRTAGPEQRRGVRYRQAHTHCFLSFDYRYLGAHTRTHAYPGFMDDSFLFHENKAMWIFTGSGRCTKKLVRVKLQGNSGEDTTAISIALQVRDMLVLTSRQMPFEESGHY